jgi:hypothetical protein
MASRTGGQPCADVLERSQFVRSNRGNLFHDATIPAFAKKIQTDPRKDMEHAADSCLLIHCNLTP